MHVKRCFKDTFNQINNINNDNGYYYSNDNNKKNKNTHVITHKPRTQLSTPVRHRR